MSSVLKTTLFATILFLFIFSATYVIAAPPPASTLSTSIPNPNNPVSPGASAIGCSFNPFKFHLEACIGYGLLYIVTGITGVILYFSAIIFNYFIHISIAGQFFQADGSILKVVSDVWKIFRDLANMSFIFILIYIGLRTILRMSTSETYRLLGRVVLIALLVNFSLVITKVVIDASNVLAIGFYQAFSPSAFMDGFGLTGARDLSEHFLSAINPQKISGVVFEQWLKEGVGGNLFSVIVMGLTGGIANIVISFVMFAGAALFAIRLVVLIFLMMFSPLAFAAYIFPETQKYASKWWDTLIKQAFFAPIFMILFYASAKVFSSLSGAIFSSTKEGYVFALVNIIINFSIATGIAVAALIVSKSLGAYGANTIVNKSKNWSKKSGKALGTYATRNTIGRASHAFTESQFMKNQYNRTPRLASLALKPFEYGGKDYKKNLEERVKREEKLYERHAGSDDKNKKTENLLDEKGDKVISKITKKKRRVATGKEVVSKTTRDASGKIVSTEYKPEYKDEEYDDIEYAKITPEQKAIIDKLREKRGGYLSRFTPGAGLGTKKDKRTTMNKETLKSILKTARGKNKSKIQELLDEATDEAKKEGREEVENTNNNDNQDT